MMSELSTKDIVLRLYDEVTAMRKDVSALAELRHTVEDHEDRLRGVERWRWGIPGGLVAVVLGAFGIHIT
jgi:hypothetical protein